MRFTELRAAAGETVDASYGVYINDENMNHKEKSVTVRIPIVD